MAKTYQMFIKIPILIRLKIYWIDLIPLLFSVLLHHKTDQRLVT